MDIKTQEMLAQKAIEARESSYCPYSHFAVGAALLCADGTIYTGGNIENSGYSATNCAERTAIFKAVSEGKRDFVGIAVAGGEAGKPPEELCPPCGICRQVMTEFCAPDFEVVLTDGSSVKLTTLAELLPLAFGAENLN